MRCVNNAIRFSSAVRLLNPVCELEEMRNMKQPNCEEDEEQMMLSPSEALLCAIEHDHQPYAQYLLCSLKEKALGKSIEWCSCSPTFLAHITLAVRHQRINILRQILQVASLPPEQHSKPNNCFHVPNGKTPLHMACEMMDIELALLLLSNGASPHAVDYDGSTPLDVILEQLWWSEVTDKKCCLGKVLLYMPEVRFRLKGSLKNDPGPWTEVLGQDTYRFLSGREPAPLVLSAMRSVMTQLQTQRLEESVQRLEIPTSLKELAKPCNHCRH